VAHSPLIDLLLERAAEHGQEPYLRFGERTVTWREFAESSLRAANGLIELGIGPEDRVGIMVENSPEFLFAYFGTVAIGAGTVPLNVAQRGAALEHILTDSGCRAVVLDAPFKQAVESVVGEHVRLVVRGESSFERLMAAPDTVPEIPEKETSGLGILYTSGTTGPPKGVVAERYDLAMVKKLLGSLGVAPGETIYTSLPLFHGNALILSAMGAVWNRWTLALAPRFSASRLWDDTRTYGAVAFNVLGAMVPILLKQPERPDDADNPVRVVFSAACPAWAWREFEERFNVRLIEFYGLVDYPGYLLNDEGVPGSMGRPIGPTEFRVVDEDGAELPAGAPGELVMRHPLGQITHYHNMPAETAQAYRGGWFHTGDLAIVDDEGRFTYAGRKKESMRRRGENISAWEIESVVNRHPGVLECAAHAVPSELGEDDVKLVVVLQPDTRLTPEEIIEFCDGQMAAYAVPAFIEFCAALPKTGTHRVRYEVLKANGITPETWARPLPERRG
jgi:crotonobetaine/carnitine-CoA ligase